MAGFHKVTPFAWTNVGRGPLILRSSAALLVAAEGDCVIVRAVDSTGSVAVSEPSEIKPGAPMTEETGRALLAAIMERDAISLTSSDGGSLMLDPETGDVFKMAGG